MKALTRVPIFSYNTISTTLLIPTKSLEIKFRKTFLTTETLFELESILAWCATHSEVQSLLITSFGTDFIQGFDPEELKTCTEEKIKTLYSKISTIAESFLCLPQTVIADLKMGTKGVGIELALAADIRIAKNEAAYSFNHLEHGLVPACGLFSFLFHRLNQSALRSFLLSGAEFNNDALKNMGGWIDVNAEAAPIMERIFNQAPVARMQAKRALYGQSTAEKKKSEKVEKEIFNAVVRSRDYTRSSDFMNVNEFKSNVVNGPKIEA